MNFIKTIPALAAIGALFAQSAFACEQWDISGPRTIDQANGIAVLAEFVQDGA